LESLTTIRLFSATSEECQQTRSLVTLRSHGPHLPVPTFRWPEDVLASLALNPAPSGSSFASFVNLTVTVQKQSF
jgi:hypothetical protein